MTKNPYYSSLQNILTPGRLEHSLGVMQVMSELAEGYGLDREMAQTTGLLHDAGKDLPTDQQQWLIKEGDIQIRHECEREYLHYLHAPVGAYLVQSALGIKDELILGAISSHTFFGSSACFNHPLSWCLRFADLLEPNRDWAGENQILNVLKELRKLFFPEDWPKLHTFTRGHWSNGIKRKESRYTQIWNK